MLLFWDIIYMPVPEVFQHQYQMAPLDFGTLFFYMNRKKIIDDYCVFLSTCTKNDLFSKFEIVLFMPSRTYSK